MEERKELLEVIMRQVQREYRQIEEIGRLTKELGDALSRSDRESVQLLLEMRQTEMDLASEIEREINMVLEAIDPATCAEIRDLRDSKKEMPEGEATFEEKKIKELSKSIRHSLDQTICLDRVISNKLAGKDSYYVSAEQV